MRIAVISDVHANLEALRAVLADIRRRRADAIVSLGDVIGYGPDPIETADLVRTLAAAAVRGNHEILVTEAIDETTSPLAAQSARWTRRKLLPAPRASAQKKERWAWLAGLPRYVKFEHMIFAHGSPQSPFVYISEIHEAARVFERHLHGTSICFVGHTHVPCVFVEDRGDILYLPAETGRRYRFRGTRAIVNVGSVGQPRDFDPRASYVLVRDDGSIEFRRIEYDVEATARKIFAIRELPNALGERLLIGE